ncbi:CHAT domain-containing protein [Mycena rebaudengoi]|nr:CHAT domain-containing protein [Mycena rebaudengoi]
MAGWLQGLAASFRDLYQQSGDVKHLEAALQNSQAAVELTPEGHPNLAERLQSLAMLFTDRYQRSEDVKNLEAALQNNQAAVTQTPKGHPDLAGHLQSLAVLLTDRYRRSGDVKDLEAALQNNQAAVEKTPKGHPDLAGHLQNLAVSFTDRYQRSGDVKDLEAALQHKQAAVAQTPKGHPALAGFGDVKDLEAALQKNQAAVEQTPEGHPDLAGRLENLAISFSDQYHGSGDLKDLEAALQHKQAAMEQTPKGHPDLARRFQSLAVSFTDRYRRSGDLKDLEAALQNNQAAVEQTPKGHPDLVERLQSLAISFTDRYKTFGDMKDLEAALQNKQAAVEQTPKGHPDGAGDLQCLAVSFRDRYRRSGNVKDLEAALQNDQAAVEQTPKGHPDLAGYLQNLAVSFANRYQRSGDVRNLEAALQNDQVAVEQTPKGHPHLAGRLQNLAISFRDRYQRSGNVKDLESALFSYSSSFQYNTSDPVRSWHSALNWASFAKVHRPADILKAYAAAFHLLPEILWIGSAVSVRQDVNMRINVSQATSNAISACIDSSNLPLAVELLEQGLGTTFQQLLQLKTNLDFLPQEEAAKLKLLSPIYVALNANGIISGRLWWCPTGDFTGLPFHAANPGDQFIQSYTPTLGALLEANSKTPPTDPPRIGLVGVTHTGPQRDQELPGVEEEITKISSIAGDKYQVQSLIGKNTTVDSVKQTLNDCAWIHLACHGEQNIIEPPKSCLQLYGGTLELETILQMSLPNAEFVVLAACQTAKGDAALVNGSFHLGGGFIAAGFQGAIATMWSMDDKDGPIVAETVYSHLLGSGKRPQASEAAKALQLAVRKMRDAGVPHEQWVPVTSDQIYKCGARARGSAALPLGALVLCETERVVEGRWREAQAKPATVESTTTTSGETDAGSERKDQRRLRGASEQSTLSTQRENSKGGMRGAQENHHPTQR